jgi:hypothetical protein
VGKQNNSYGLTTLKNPHVAVEVRFRDAAQGFGATSAQRQLIRSSRAGIIRRNFFLELSSAHGPFLRTLASAQAVRLPDDQ